MSGDFEPLRPEEWLFNLAWEIHSALADSRLDWIQDALRRWNFRQSLRKRRQKRWERKRDQFVFDPRHRKAKPPKTESPGDAWEEHVAVWRGMVKVPSNFKLVPPPDDKDESQQAFDESQQAFYNLVQDKILADPSRYCEPGDPRADGKGWVSTGDKGIECVGYVPPVYAERNRPKTDLPLPLGDDDPDLLDKCAVLAVVHDFGTKTVTKLAPWLAVQQDLPLRDVGGEENIRIAVLRYPFDTLLGKVGDLSEADKRPIEKFLADVLADLGTPTATGGVDDSEWSQEMGKSQLAKVLDMHPNTLAKRIKNGDIAVREISSKRIKVRLSDLPEEARKRWA